MADDNPNDVVPAEFAADDPFLMEMRTLSLAQDLMMRRLELLVKALRNCMTIAGIVDPDELSKCYEVADTVAFIAELDLGNEIEVGELSSEQLDVSACVEIALLTSYRLALALNQLAKRKLDPTYTEDPDAPLEI